MIPDVPAREGAGPAMAADVDLPEAVEGGAASPRFAAPVFYVGSAGLLIAAGTDALAVLGRHVGFRLVGSIEVVQLAVVLIASAAIVGTTLLRAHAAVHLFTARLAAPTARRLARGADLLSALACAALATGSTWMAIELWNGAEETELLALPIRPFRLIWIAATSIAAIVFLVHALRRSDA